MRATRISASSFISCSRIDRTSERSRKSYNVSTISAASTAISLILTRHLLRSTFSKLIENGEVSVEKAQSAYRETLDIVLGQVERLVERLPGKALSQLLIMGRCLESELCRLHSRNSATHTSTSEMTYSVPHIASSDRVRNVASAAFLRPEFCIEAVGRDGPPRWNYGRIDGERIAVGGWASRRRDASPDGPAGFRASVVKRWNSSRSTTATADATRRR